jgi:chromosome segregation ATPase
MNNIAAFSQVVNNFNQVISTIRLQLNEVRTEVHHINIKLQTYSDSLGKITEEATIANKYVEKIGSLEKSFATLNEQFAEKSAQLLEVNTVLSQKLEREASHLTIEQIQNMIDDSLAMFLNSITNVSCLNNNTDTICAENITVEVPSIMDMHSNVTETTVNSASPTEMPVETLDTSEPTNSDNEVIESEGLVNVKAAPKTASRGRGGRRGGRGTKI